MKKIRLKLFFIILSMASYQYSYAHGSGGGSSYDFDKSNRAANQADKRAAEKINVEEKKQQDDWSEFMKAVNAPKKENLNEKEHGQNHHDGVTEK